MCQASKTKFRDKDQYVPRFMEKGMPGFETLAGFLLSQLGHIPEPGESVEHEGRTYTVTQMERNRIARVRIEPNEPVETDES